MTTLNEPIDPDYGFTEAQRSWPQELKDAYRAYHIDDTEFDYVGGIYAARSDRPDEVAQFHRDRQDECCGWHEDTIDVLVDGEPVQLVVGFSYGH